MKILTGQNSRFEGKTPFRIHLRYHYKKVNNCVCVNTKNRHKLVALEKVIVTINVKTEYNLLW